MNRYWQSVGSRHLIAPCHTHIHVEATNPIIYFYPFDGENDCIYARTNLVGIESNFLAYSRHHCKLKPFLGWPNLAAFGINYDFKLSC